MSDPSAFPYVAAEYGRLAKWVVEETGDVAKGLVDSMDAGTYDAKGYANAMGRLFTIGMMGAIGWVDATVTAAAILDGRGPRPHRLVKMTQSVGPQNAERSLSVATPFTRSTPNEAIASALVSFEPSKLAANASSFDVCVNATDLPSGLYLGSVLVGPATGGEVLDVMIVL